MLPTVYLVRHGHTDSNANTGPTPDEFIRGWRNVPLNAEGQKSAKAVARTLARQGVDHIYTSDMDRAHDTAQAIHEKTKAHVTKAIALRDWHMGIHEGEPVTRVLPTLLRHATRDTSRPVEGGESFDTYTARLLPFMRQILDDTAANGKRVAIVTHGRNTRVVKGWIEKGMNGNEHKQEYLKRKHPPVQPGEMLVLQYANGQWKVRP